MKHSKTPGNQGPINIGYCCVQKNMQIVKHSHTNKCYPSICVVAGEHNCLLTKIENTKKYIFM